MSGRRPILVGVDGSRASIAALQWAVSEAARRDLTALAVMVHLPQGQIMIGAVPYDALPPSGLAAEHADCVRRLADAVGEVDPGAVTIDQVVVSGRPGAELAKLSDAAEMLVVGSHGHNRLSDVVLGTVGSYCVRHAACPVVVIPRQAWDREGVSHGGH
ncbi:MAG: universal stress protein [Kibdelosporangium sp.]